MNTRKHAEVLMLRFVLGEIPLRIYLNNSPTAVPYHIIIFDNDLPVHLTLVFEKYFVKIRHAGYVSRNPGYTLPSTTL